MQTAATERERESDKRTNDTLLDGGVAELLEHLAGFGVRGDELHLLLVLDGLRLRGQTLDRD